MKMERQPEVFVYLFALLANLSQIVEALKLKTPRALCWTYHSGIQPLRMSLFFNSDCEHLCLLHISALPLLGISMLMLAFSSKPCVCHNH